MMKSHLYIALVIILFSILYFIYRFIQQRESNIDHFEVMSQRSDSIYYQNRIDDNVLEILQKAADSSKNMGYLATQMYDPFTGAWSNFSESNNTSLTATTDDMILLLRKIDSQLFVAMTRRNLNQNNGGQTKPTNELYPMFMFIGLAKITTPSEATINNVLSNQFTTSTSSDSNNTVSFSSDTITVSLYGITYTFNQKRELTKENYYNPLQVILPSFKTTSTSLTDVVCPIGKSQCTLDLGDSINQKSCAIPSLITNGICNTPTATTTDICTLEDNDITSGTITISKCPTSFNILQNNADYMINNIFTSPNGQGQVVSCTYLDNLTNWKNYIIIYAKDSTNMTMFGYQIWGLEPKDNKVVTKSSRISNYISQKMQNNNDIKTQIQAALNEPSSSTPAVDTSAYQINNNDYPQMWKFNKAYKQGTCYFTLQSVKSASQPTYYLNYQDNGDLFMTLSSGGFKQFFTLDDFKEIYTPSSGKYGIYAGNFKAANNFYISPGRIDYQELNPQSSQVNVKVCNLVSQINQSGKWIILGFNDEPNSILSQI